MMALDVFLMAVSLYTYCVHANTIMYVYFAPESGNLSNITSTEACGSKAKSEHILIKKLLCDLSLKKECTSSYMF